MVATLVFLHLRVGKVPQSVAVRQPVALLDEDLQAIRDVVVVEGEDDVSPHLRTVKVSRFTVNAHEAAQRALQKCENTPILLPVRFETIVKVLPSHLKKRESQQQACQIKQMSKDLPLPSLMRLI